MSNDFYTATEIPLSHSRGASAPMRNEFAAIQAAFDAVQEQMTLILAQNAISEIYQGAQASDPDERVSGDPLEAGDLYFNTLSGVLKAYSGTAWAAIPTSSSQILTSGGTFVGPIEGTSADFSGTVEAGSFSGSGAALTGLTSTQITTALGFTPVNKAGDTLTGALNGTSATFSGTVQGATVQQTCDERLKKNWRRVPADFVSRLAKIKKAGIFSWRRKGMGDGVGVSAQALREIVPEAVLVDEKGRLQVNAAFAMLAVVELARAVEDLRAKVEALK